MRFRTPASPIPPVTPIPQGTMQQDRARDVDQLRDSDQARDQDQNQDRDQDLDRGHIYGVQLMTQAERNTCRTTMRTLKTDQEREAFRMQLVERCA